MNVFKTTIKLTSCCALIFMFFILSGNSLAANQLIYDFAKLLTSEEVEHLESLAASYGQETEVDIVILTTNHTDGKTIEQFMGDFYDEKGLGFDKVHGNTVILTIDMNEREVYVAGFYKGEEYINNYRAELIRKEITPYLSEGDFYGAFSSYINLTKHYLGIKPEIPSQPNVSPPNNYVGQPNNNNKVEYSGENVFFNPAFQIFFSLFLGTLVVGIMAYRSSPKKTTNSRTYLDESRSVVTARRDSFIRKTVTKIQKPKNNNKGSGGGFTGGGRSHSGSKGRF